MNDTELNSKEGERKNKYMPFYIVGKDGKEKVYPPLFIKDKYGYWTANPRMTLYKSTKEGESKPDICPICHENRFSRTAYLGNINYECDECGYSIYYQDTDYRFFDT